MISELCERAKRRAAGVPLSLKNDAQASDFFNDLFCCE